MAPVTDSKFYTVSGILLPATTQPEIAQHYPIGMPPMERHRAIRNACLDSLADAYGGDDNAGAMMGENWDLLKLLSVGHWIERDIMTEAEARFYVNSGIMMVARMGDGADQKLALYMRRIHIRLLICWDLDRFRALLAESKQQNLELLPHLLSPEQRALKQGDKIMVNFIIKGHKKPAPYEARVSGDTYIDHETGEFTAVLSWPVPGSTATRWPTGPEQLCVDLYNCASREYGWWLGWSLKPPTTA